MPGSLKRKTINLKAESGVEIITDTVLRSNRDFEYVIALADSVLQNTTTFKSGFNNAGSNAIGAGLAIPKGAALPLRLTAIQLLSGSVICVNKVSE